MVDNFYANLLLFSEKGSTLIHMITECRTFKIVAVANIVLYSLQPIKYFTLHQTLLTQKILQGSNHTACTIFYTTHKINRT